jgi:hypothetical protein
MPATIEESISEKWSETRSTLDQYLRDGEEFVRAEPLKAVAYAAATGYVLRMLPVGTILGGLVSIVLAAVKPAALVYGAAKGYEIINRPKDDQQTLI